MGRCCCILVRNRRLPLTSCHRRTSSPKSDSAGELTQTRRHLCGVSNGTMRNEHVKMRGTKDLPVLQKKKRKKSNNTMSGDNNFIQDEKGASREQGLYFVI